MPYEMFLYGRLVYVLDGEMGPPTLNNWTRLVGGKPWIVAGGAQPLVKEKLQVLPP